MTEPRRPFREEKKDFYPRDTAGHVMTTKIPVALSDQSIHELTHTLKAHADHYDTINYLYVLSEDHILIGVLSVRELFSAAPDKTVGEVCIREPLYSVHPESHQEKAAYLALRHGIKAVPVVDKQHRFLGELSADSILKILHKEMHEDTLKRAGIRHPAAIHSNVLNLSLTSSFLHRIPWLLFGLLGGVFAASVIGFFESVLAKNLVLAAFIPLIVYMSGAVGTQMVAYIIRDLALEKDIFFLRYLFRNALIVGCIAIALSSALYGFYGLFSRDWFMSFVISISLFGAILSSVFTGLMVPYFFSKCSLDPADASGPVATIIQDILSILIYFTIASFLL